MEFLPIASSSSGCAYLLTEAGQPPLLIDAGVHVDVIRQTLGSLGKRITDLAGCLLSHGHGDHAKSIGDVMKACVDVYASAETGRSGIKGWLDHRASIVLPQKSYRVGPWSVMPFEAEHDEPGTLGFLVDSPAGDRLFFLTDSAYSRYAIPAGCTHVAIETNWSEELIKASATDGRVNAGRFERTANKHMSLERAVRLLQDADLTTVREIHALHLSSENSDEAMFKRVLQEATGKPVYIAAERAGVPF